MRLDPASLQGRVLALGLLVLLAAGSWHLLLQPTIDSFQEKHEALARAQRSFLQYQRRTPPLAELEARRAGDVTAAADRPEGLAQAAGGGVVAKGWVARDRRIVAVHHFNKPRVRLQRGIDYSHEV